MQASGSSAVTLAGNGYVTLTPSPIYAAPALSGANIMNVPGTWDVSGGGLYYNDGNAGIGTSSPNQPLTVQAGTASNSPLLGFYSQAGADQFNFSLQGGART